MILDHYMPGAADSEREAARSSLRALGKIVLAINERHKRMAEAEDSPASSENGILDATPET